MKKNIICLLLAALFLLTAACSAAPHAAAPGGTANYSTAAAPSAAPPMGEVGLYSGAEERYSDSDAYAHEDAKLIREASLSLESTEYDTALAELDHLTAACGGYYGESDMWGNNVYGSGNRSASFVVRIPAEGYNTFLGGVGEVAHIVSRNESAVDIGSEYYDTELRLQTARTKHDRLLSLLEKADKMEDIITLETTLAQVQYEIDRYSGTLRRYDGLVDYATIRISLQEVVRLTERAEEPDGAGARIQKAAQEGATGFVRRLVSLTEFLAYNIIGLGILIAGAVVGVLIWRRQVRRGHKHPKSPE